MRIVDLTHPITDGMATYPGDPSVSFNRVSTIPKSDFNITEVTFGTHSGTHVDAPYHCIDEGITVDRISLESCIGIAEVLDIIEKGPNSDIDIPDLERFAERIEPGCRLLLRTGWSKRFGENNFFTEYPNITPALAIWLAEKGVRLLGLEQPSPSTKHSLEVHDILLKAEIVLVEAMANLSDLQSERVLLVVLPLKLIGLDGSPARVIAVEQD